MTFIVLTGAGGEKSSSASDVADDGGIAGTRIGDVALDVFDLGLGGEPLLFVFAKAAAKDELDVFCFLCNPFGDGANPSGRDSPGKSPDSTTPKPLPRLLRPLSLLFLPFVIEVDDIAAIA
mmetsp:Transcript_1755/g.3716  ORF Transcript_1755/g.3716 Transcript_1755/m.3716 type:complete len:121 (+) Transcript_1755:344-706(+)